jgi:predicted RNase H-like HicB family nuclease
MEYTAIINQTSDGWYAAKCAQIPEAVTQGRTPEEVKENLIDAVNLVLEVKRERAIKEAMAIQGSVFSNFAMV